MIKVSVMYPNKPGARFDWAYYLDKHMPMVKARMGSALKFYAVDKGIGGGSPGDPATYLPETLRQMYSGPIEVAAFAIGIIVSSM